MKENLRINRLPVPTWNRLQVNDASVEWDSEEAAQKEFDISKLLRADELLEQEVTIDTSFLDNMKIKPQKETQLDNVPILENPLLKQQEGKGQ